ncbi:hypothetical protein COLO4_24458 [Corchorus olitorius]|uniref:Uncharacterized protein n=1 Tax=Corchorus olitorius TaxID=93759 RepID=A0A1R3I9X5_9ROSI|nr:hypothetical protein COLO4_24458 [Corchorus olitorius]
MSGTESRGRSGEEDDQLERSTKKVKAAAVLVDGQAQATHSFKDAMMGGKGSRLLFLMNWVLWNPMRVDESNANPVVIGDEQQGAIDGGQQQDSIASGGAQHEPTVNSPTRDFGPWMIAQSRKPRRNVNHVPKSRAPVNSGGGEKAGSRFSALAEEGQDLNLEEDISHEEREQETQKQPRKSTNVGPANVPEKAVGTTNVMESNAHDPNTNQALRNHHRANMVKEKSVRTMTGRTDETSDSFENSEDDAMEDIFNSSELDPGASVLDVRLRRPPDDPSLDTVVLDSQAQVVDMQVEGMELQGLNNDDVDMNQLQRPFRFQAMWLSHEGFLSLVNGVWTSTDGDFCGKGEKLVESLQAWNRDEFGNIFERKKKLRARIASLQRSLALYYSHQL